MPACCLTSLFVRGGESNYTKVLLDGIPVNEPGGAVYLTSDRKPTYTITAEVEQAPNLFEQGRVMVRGVEVGTIVVDW